MSLGDIRLGDTIDVKFSTAVNGVPTALSSGAVSAYVDNGTGEITAGVTLSADFDGLTGLNNVRIVASSGNGFASGTNVDLVLTGGTVGSSSVTGRQIDSFSIEKRSALMPTTAARTLDVSAGGEAGLDWANIGSPTTAQNLSATNIDVDQVVASVSGAVGSVAGLTPGTIADQVWEETLADHSGTVGSTAEQLAAAGAAGDPWATQLPGAYGAGSAGKIVGDNLDAPVSDVKTQTDKLTFDVDNTLDANVQKINDTELTGDGTVGTPWGPV